MNIPSLKVRRGDPIRPAIVDLRNTQKALRLLAGRGVILSYTPSGVVVNARETLRGFVGSWFCSFSGADVVVGVGYVDGIEPLIDGRLMSGVLADGKADPKGVPRLTLREDLYTAAGKSWIGIRAVIDGESGKIIAPENGLPELTIVQRREMAEGDDKVHFQPIAMMKRPAGAKTGFGNIHQISYFDFQHRTTFQNGKWRHFMDPA